MTETSASTAIILLVEDDLGDVEITRRAFERGRLRNRLEIVSDGQEALDYLLRRGPYADPERSPRPDLVLLDLNLPRVDGKQVLQEIRQHESLRSIPVVALTTSQQQEDVMRTYDLGVNSYISKPVNMGQFIEVLKALGNYWFEVVTLPNRRG